MFKWIRKYFEDKQINQEITEAVNGFYSTIILEEETISDAIKATNKMLRVAGFDTTYKKAVWEPEQGQKRTECIRVRYDYSRITFFLENCHRGGAATDKDDALCILDTIVRAYRKENKPWNF